MHAVRVIAARCTGKGEVHVRTYTIHKRVRRLGKCEVVARVGLGGVGETGLGWATGGPGSGPGGGGGGIAGKLGSPTGWANERVGHRRMKNCFVHLGLLFFKRKVKVLTSYIMSCHVTCT